MATVWPLAKRAAKGTAVPPAEARRCPAPTADHAHTRSQPHLVEDENDLLLYDYWSTLSVVFFRVLETSETSQVGHWTLKQEQHALCGN